MPSALAARFDIDLDDILEKLDVARGQSIDEAVFACVAIAVVYTRQLEKGFVILASERSCPRIQDIPPQLGEWGEFVVAQRIQVERLYHPTVFISEQIDYDLIISLVGIDMVKNKKGIGLDNHRFRSFNRGYDYKTSRLRLMPVEIFDKRLTAQQEVERVYAQR